MRKSPFLIIAPIVLAGCASVAPRAEIDSLQREVMEVERRFARSMANRDHAAFTSFLSEEAVFFSGETPVRGKQAVAADWRRFFEGPDPPFSWEPDRVEVLESGSLALSSGPVYDPAGKVIGRFNSIWRRERSGEWRVVFDKGSPVCPDPT
jgi:ketosteroid isomerase-like protein